ncbi:hypothetical protein [Deinococcus humi]|uniref:Uncharacterized protein n=1 Tax=Deinococcus humi TaxID=662880 RepID=A0A7W8NDB6_9DEIO|nr:hypothetical protein [Deinococcus humi]MBB5363074.1 hypothetical protein [Deinococcus humi]GGO24853.1 hypothetical protein GCM10008949_14120 [Deinococcus humi]
MKRRTRLRKMGLPADPKPVPRKTEPSFYDLAVSAVKELEKTGLPNSWANNLDFLEDCRRYGVSHTVNCMRLHGLLPSRLKDMLGSPWL